MKISLEDQFNYHPPTTEERKAKHDRINQASLAFAKELIDVVGENDPYAQRIIDLIQQARMIANQVVTYQDIAPKAADSTEAV